MLEIMSNMLTNAKLITVVTVGYLCQVLPRSQSFTTFNTLTLRASNRVSYSTHLTSDAVDPKKK